ncbi:MAG: hypothetical protein KA735_04995 [Burkholderiaceae bacterium]|nr:hypothetical protein [Burkholderiaceae bacterium]
MQAATLPFLSGWQWIRDGYKLFLTQPLAMLFWSMMTSVLITASYLIPILGQMILIASTPILTFISLSACQHIAAGRQMRLPMWTEPLRVPETRRSLFGLGLAYLASCLTAGLLSTLPFLDGLAAAINDQGVLDEKVLIAAMQGPFITFGLLYVIISILFWHAPPLIGWHKIKITQALFFSMVACWRNKGPFLLYVISWAGIFFALQFFAEFLGMLGLSPGSTQMLLTPLNIVLAAVLYCSFYPAYISIFGANKASAT